MARPNRQAQNAAYNTFRSPAPVYQALKSRPSQKFIKRSLAASFDDNIIEGDDKHAMYIRNLSGLIPEYYQPAAPAAGANFTITVPAGEYWELLEMNALFTTDANAANRRAFFIFDNGASTGEIWRTIAESDHTASQAWRYELGRGLQNRVVLQATVEQAIPSSLGILPAGSRILSSVGSIQAGDAWSQITLLIKRHIDLRISTGAADYATNYMTLKAGEEKYFPIHYGGLWPLQFPAGAYQSLFHCEWDDELHVVNPSATSTCPIEVLVIG